MKTIYLLLIILINGSCYFIKTPKNKISGLKNTEKWEINKEPKIEIINQKFNLSNCSYKPKVILINTLNEKLNVNDNLGFSFLDFKIQKQVLKNKIQDCQSGNVEVFYNVSNDDTTYGIYKLDSLKNNFIELTKINEKRKCVEGTFQAHFIRAGGDRSTDPIIDFTNIKFEIYY